MHLQGAERQVRFPSELPRFATLPMRVEYTASPPGGEGGQGSAGSSTVDSSSSRRSDSGGGSRVEVCVLEFMAWEEAAGVTRWRLADVRANRKGGKGRALNRKQREQVWDIPLGALRRVNLHLDI